MRNNVTTVLFHGTLEKQQLTNIEEFAPWTPGWESAFPTYFNQTLRASFNTTMYDYNGLFAFFGAASESINGRFTDFGTNLTNVVTSVNPSNAKEGVVSLQGLEGGNSRATGEFTAGANSVFAVVNVVGGEQKIVEWRELNLVH